MEEVPEGCWPCWTCSHSGRDFLFPRTQVSLACLAPEASCLKPPGHCGAATAASWLPAAPTPRHRRSWLPSTAHHAQAFDLVAQLFAPRVIVQYQGQVGDRVLVGWDNAGSKNYVFFYEGVITKLTPTTLDVKYTKYKVRISARSTL